MRRQSYRWMMVVATAATIAAGAVAAAPVAAAPRPAASGNGWVRFGHFAPAAAPVDLYVDGAPVATGIAYKTMSEYLAVAAGPHDFAVRPTGQPEATPLLDLEAGVPDGQAVTIGAVVTRDGLAAQVYDDDLTPPADGQALVRFIHAVPDQQPIDVAVAGGPTIAAAVTYPSATAYLPIQAGTYDVDVRAAGTLDVLLHIAGWSIAPGAQASVIIIDGADGKLDVVPVVDSAAAVVTPSGGIQTGYGGMAAMDTSASAWQRGLPMAMIASIAIAIAVAITGGLGVLAVRRRRTVRS